jgi:hypothetical protein
MEVVIINNKSLETFCPILSIGKDTPVSANCNQCCWRSTVPGNSGGLSVGCCVKHLERLNDIAEYIAVGIDID